MKETEPVKAEDCLLYTSLRGVLRYAEQASNHYIAFKLLALIRDKVFGALRRLTPAKLEGRDRGDLISLITACLLYTSCNIRKTHGPHPLSALGHPGSGQLFKKPAIPGT